jgi:penicillin-binding protein 1A
MKVALADKPGVPFKVPPGIKLIRIDPKSGLRAGPGQASIIEAFKPGTAPPDAYSIIGYGGGQGEGQGTVSPEADRGVRSGTGGLY